MDAWILTYIKELTEALLEEEREVRLSRIERVRDWVQARLVYLAHKPPQ